MFDACWTSNYAVPLYATIHRLYIDIYSVHLSSIAATGNHFLTIISNYEDIMKSFVPRLNGTENVPYAIRVKWIPRNFCCRWCRRRCGSRWRDPRTAHIIQSFARTIKSTWMANNLRIHCVRWWTTWSWKHFPNSSWNVDKRKMNGKKIKNKNENRYVHGPLKTSFAAGFSAKWRIEWCQFYDVLAI